jgi:hypothetical protein
MATCIHGIMSTGPVEQEVGSPQNEHTDTEGEV